MDPNLRKSGITTLLIAIAVMGLIALFSPGAGAAALEAAVLQGAVTA